MRAIILSLFTPAILIGCTSTGNTADEPRGVAKYADDPRLGGEVDRVCFASTIDSFGNNSRNTFTVREGMDHYLIEVFGTCSSLKDAQQIAIDATGSCLSKGDGVIVSDSIAGFDDRTGIGPQRCIVDAIYDWDPKAQKTDEETKIDEES